MYFPEYDFVFLDIFKNGSNVFSRLFEYVLGSKGDGPNFIREPNIYISVVRNPYDRVVSRIRVKDIQAMMVIYIHNPILYNITKIHHELKYSKWKNLNHMRYFFS